MNKYLITPLLVLSMKLFAADSPPNRYFLETFGNNYAVKVYLDNFGKLSARDKKLAYHLAEFTLATRDFSFIQSHPRGLELRNFIEDWFLAYRSLKGQPGYKPEVDAALEEYLKTFYLWHGPYVWGGQNKIVLNLSDDEASDAMELAEKTGKISNRSWKSFSRILLDPDFEPYMKGPKGEIGAQTFYEPGLKAEEIKKFRDAKYPHKYIPVNSYLYKKDGKIEEDFIRIGGKGILLPTPMPDQGKFNEYQLKISDIEKALKDASGEKKEGLEKEKAALEEKRDHLYFNWVEKLLDGYLHNKPGVFVKADVPAGMHADLLKKAMPHLEAAIALLPMGDDKASLEFTKRALESSDSNVVYSMAAGIASNRSKEAVRLSAGFGDSYLDPLGQSATWTSWLFQTSASDLVKKLTAPKMILALQASIPWERSFDNPKPVPNSTLIDWMPSIGGLCPACPSGFNTNDDHLGRFAPSLSTVVVNWTTARNQGAPPGSNEEFLLGKATQEQMKKSQTKIGTLPIILHESLGHAIGLRKPNYGEELAPHGHMLEEARAEGSAAFFMSDPRVLKLAGLKEEDLKNYYLDFITKATLVTLNRIPEGDNDYKRPHERAFNLISRYLLVGKYGVRIINEDGKDWKRGQKVYFEITDVKKVREGLGKLLSELMWIIGKGDKEKAEKLDAAYGPPHDATWLLQARERATKVGYKPQWVALLPELKAEKKGSAISKVTVWHDESFLKQQLRFSGKQLP